jgi:hypothetical protein
MPEEITRVTIPMDMILSAETTYLDFKRGCVFISKGPFSAGLMFVV